MSFSSRNVLVIVVFDESAFQVRGIADIPTSFDFLFDDVDVIHTKDYSKVCSSRIHVKSLARLYVVPSAGFEPTTFWFEARRSIQLSYEGSSCFLSYTQKSRRVFLLRLASRG